jgi:hypothetical protein
MPNNEPKLYFEDVKYNLEKITYKAVKPNHSDADISMKPVDEYCIKSIDFDEILITVTRTINFEPKSLFSLVVESVLFLPLNQKEKKFTGSKEELISYTNDHIDTIINNSSLMETISLLISQISSSYGRIPIITPPFFLKPETAE